MVRLEYILSQTIHVDIFVGTGGYRFFRTKTRQKPYWYLAFSQQQGYVGDICSGFL